MSPSVGRSQTASHSSTASQRLTSSKYENAVRLAKTAGRSELDLFEWQKYNYRLNDYWIDESRDTVPRIPSTYPKEAFQRDFEESCRPVVITGLADTWRAKETWKQQASTLLKRYKNQTFKVGEDDNGDNVYLKFKYFLRYANKEAQQDDSPLYIFDSGFMKEGRGMDDEERERLKAKREKRATLREKSSERSNKRAKVSGDDKDASDPRNMLDDYVVPHFFADDLFKHTGERRRPPYRWFVMGSARSGTGIHIDPLGTSAWNTVIEGHKRWCLFPPWVSKETVDPPGKPDHEAATWFSVVFPKLKEKDAAGVPLSTKLGMIEILQKPGETVFVPGGWHHVVMNLDLSIAITQNFCSPINLEYVYLRTRHSRPKLARKLYRKIREQAETGSKEYQVLVDKLDSLTFVPKMPPSSSSSGSSSTSTSSSSEEDARVSDTESEDDRDGICMCRKCKMKRKKAALKAGQNLT
ncbi:hypothetical protein BZG36_04224 [Bifiguratus adelaidae]|uniref:JmjC domain-containing protein n=1 Tax=Bifiguratus adelaidae TaxID=1938954 RepID=A0A261XY84_9FUNG|nr:hypothetical protein BZG36_04224 [Bifiguratus adelaidae]